MDVLVALGSPAALHSPLLGTRPRHVPDARPAGSSAAYGYSVVTVAVAVSYGEEGGGQACFETAPPPLAAPRRPSPPLPSPRLPSPRLASPRLPSPPLASPRACRPTAP